MKEGTKEDLAKHRIEKAKEQFCSLWMLLSPRGEIIEGDSILYDQKNRIT